MTISKRARFEIFKRDGFACQYCGRRPPDVLLEVDHITAKANGGTDDRENLTTSCFACNRGKGAVPLGTVLPALDEMVMLENVQEMMERAAGIRSSAVAAEQERLAVNDAIAQIRVWWRAALGDDGAVVDASLRRFLQDLSPNDVRSAIDIAALRRNAAQWQTPSDSWKYFCGVCWKTIRDGKGA